MTGRVVEELDSQHRRVAELFEEVASPDADRPVVLQELLRELAGHLAAERSALQPVAGSDEVGGRDLADGLADDYKRMEHLMVLIERRKVNSPDVPDLVSQLKVVSEQHAARAEARLFPGLRSLPDAEQRELGEKVDRDDELVLTHPHPHLLSLGPVAAKLTGLLARFDRSRDRTVTAAPPSGREAERTAASRVQAPERGAGDPSGPGDPAVSAGEDRPDFGSKP